MIQKCVLGSNRTTASPASLAPYDRPFIITGGKRSSHSGQYGVRELQQATERQSSANETYWRERARAHLPVASLAASPIFMLQ